MSFVIYARMTKAATPGLQFDSFIHSIIAIDRLLDHATMLRDTLLDEIISVQVGKQSTEFPACCRKET